MRAFMLGMLLGGTAQAAEVPQFLPVPLTQEAEQAEPLDYVDTRSPEYLLKAALRGNRITLAAGGLVGVGSAFIWGGLLAPVNAEGSSNLGYGLSLAGFPMMIGGVVLGCVGTPITLVRALQFHKTAGPAGYPRAKFWTGLALIVAALPLLVLPVLSGGLAITGALLQGSWIRDIARRQGVGSLPASRTKHVVKHIQPFIAPDPRRDSSVTAGVAMAW